MGAAPRAQGEGGQFTQTEGLDMKNPCSELE